MIDKIQKWLYVNKEGIVIGMIAGLVVTIYMYSTGANMMLAVQKQSMLDPLLESAMSLKEIAITKVGLMYMFLFGAIGGIIDSIYKPGK